MKIFSVLSPLAIWIATLALPLTIFFRPATMPSQFEELCISRRYGTRLPPKEHRTVVVHYEFDGTTYYSIQVFPRAFGLPQFDQLRVGQQVRWCIALGIPTAALSVTPKKLLMSIAEDCAFMSVFLLIFSVAGCMRICVFGFANGETIKGVDSL